MSSKTLYTSPAKLWTDAQPLGNGKIGAMVYGKVKNETVCMNHDTLWSGLPEKRDGEDKHKAFLATQKAALDGDYIKANRLSYNCMGSPVQTYLTFGNLELDFDMENRYENYTRTLDLKKAVLTVGFLQDGVNYKREYFTSFPDDVLVIRVSADKKQKINFSACLTSPLRHEISTDGDMVVLDGECPAGFRLDTETWEKKYTYFKEPEKKGVQFRGGFKIITDGGICRYADDKAIVENADSAILIFTIKTSFNGYDKKPYVDGKEYKKAFAETLSSSQSKGYDKLYQRHEEDYTKLFDKIRLDLGKSGREDMPTDERLIKFNQDKNDVSLYTLLFDFGRYLTIASSRKGSQITNLQGIWNNTIDPPWSSDYTVNINTEMNYWPTLMCGLEECYEPLIKFMQDVSVAGEKTAKRFYNARGFCMHHNLDLWVHTDPAVGNPKWAFWHGSSGWLCHNLFDYYEYTGDKKYLKDICYPIMKKAAEFYLDLLCERGDGKLSVVPATSPENAFCIGDEVVAVAKYSTMSDSICYELLQNCKKAMKEAELSDPEFEKEVDYALENMSPLSIGSDGRLKEWNEEFKESEVTHRHVSHLYALHPAHIITAERTPELADACKKTLEKRGDAGTGWSLSWKINFWARLNDGNHALKLLDMQLNYVDGAGDGINYFGGGGTYKNLFDAHPPFQIDGNFGVVSGILEMLADCRDGELKLLPALPDKWKDGKITGLRIKGGKSIDMEWKDGKVTMYGER